MNKIITFSTKELNAISILILPISIVIALTLAIGGILTIGVALLIAIVVIKVLALFVFLYKRMYHNRWIKLIKGK